MTILYWIISLILFSPASFSFAQILFYHPDHLGSTVLITKDQGVVSEIFQYDPWGERISASSQANTSYGFTGGELDPEGALYYFIHRYYDPALSCFVSPDPYLGILRAGSDLLDPQSFQPYSYTQNNPVNFVDPSGLATVDYNLNRMVVWEEGPQGQVDLLLGEDAAGGFSSSTITLARETYGTIRQYKPEMIQKMESSTSFKEVIMARANLDRYPHDRDAYAITRPVIENGTIYVWMKEDHFPVDIQDPKQRALFFMTYLHELVHVSRLLEKGGDFTPEELEMEEVIAFTEQLGVVGPYLKTVPPVSPLRLHLEEMARDVYVEARHRIETRLKASPEEKKNLLARVDQYWQGVGLPKPNMEPRK
ncbi:MAG: RHS repeat-associated core domain-containing protein [Deltaproteobacteria bacterium]|nr:RHS repeat-associated core domain-containing protein [Deltaproteobacteria bacterium]